MSDNHTTHSFEGGCHCGNMTYIFESSIALEKLGLRACACTFCRKHGQRSASDPNGSIKLSVNDKSKINRYRFALNTADFLICSVCGVYIGATLTDEDGTWMVVNVNTLRDLPPLDFPIVIHNFDAEDVAGRVARRKKIWTPVKSIPWS